MKKEKLFNVPNFFTFSRIVLLVVMWFFFFQKQKTVIGILLTFSLLTDFLDGYLARKLNQETKFGAKFDSIADNLTGISVIIWLPFLLKAMFVQNKILIIIAIVAVLSAWLLAAIKYKRNPEFHLISNKISVIVVGLFVVHSLIFTYNQIFLYLAVIISILTAIEEIAITLTHDNINENIKSIFQK